MCFAFRFEIESGCHVGIFHFEAWEKLNQTGTNTPEKLAKAMEECNCSRHLKTNTIDVGSGP